MPSPVRAELSVSRHYTDNVLDEALAVSDWYTLMRGTVGGDIDHALGLTRITLDGELRRSYVLWQEHVPPQVVVEFVSGTGATAMTG